MVLSIPTDDKLVQARLKELLEPIILFGEGPGERRERLRNILQSRGIETAMPTSVEYSTLGIIQEKQDEIFYTEGPPQLKSARMFFVQYSLPRAKARLDELRKRYAAEDKDPSLLDVDDQRREAIHQSFNHFSHVASQVGDERPVRFCRFASDGKTLATAAWSGLCKLWRSSDSSCIRTFKGHTDRAVCIEYHPAYTSPEDSAMDLDNQSKTVQFASCGADQKVILWNQGSSDPITILKGHEHRVNTVAFHPSGKYLASASHDLTWKLWDIETSTMLCDQEGHSRGVFAIGFQQEGSLVASAGMDMIGRVWDLRSGKSIHVLKGHNKQITRLDWSPDGIHIATAADDNTVRIWDLRKRRAVYTLPAHSNVVSHVSYHSNGELLMTASFDNCIKLWNGKTMAPIKVISGYEGKIMAADMTSDLKSIITANYDRTWKLFQRQNVPSEGTTDQMQIAG